MFKILWQHCHGWARFCFITAPMVMLIEVFCDLQQPTLMSQVLDNGLAKGDTTYIVATAIPMALFAVMGVCAGIGCNALSTYASLKMGEQLRQHMLAVALRSRTKGGLDPATMITRITNDVTQMQNLVMMLTKGLVRSPMLLLGGVVMSFVVCSRLAWVLLLIMPLLMFYLFYVVRKSVPLFTKVQQQIDRVNRIMRENLTGMKTIKAYVLEDNQYEQFQQANGDLQADSQSAQLVTVPLAPVVTVVLNLGVIIVLILGGHFAINDMVSDGQIIALVNYMIQITNAMINTTNTITTFSRASTSGHRVEAVFTEEFPANQLGGTQLPVDSAVEFRNVDFGFSGERRVISDVSFKVPAGKWLGIVGGTGSGKSTLINLLTNTYDVNGGAVLVGGVNVNSIQPHALHKTVAVALQNSVLFAGTIADNLAFADTGATSSEMEAALATADATQFVFAKEGGLAAPVAQRGMNFSGGQRQRLNIARALTGKPEILVLDDATSAVDQITSAHIQQVLAKERRGKTTIIVSQRVAAVRDCDQILVLQDGKVAALGTDAELLATSPFYKELVDVQLGGECHDDARN